MSRSRSELAVDQRWQRDGDGAHYAADRFRSSRARARDPRLVARLLSALPENAPPIESVLDVPCGAGRLRGGSLAAASRGDDAPTWTGVDVSHEMLAAVPDADGRLVRASATALPFPDGSFDLVLCCRLLHHLAEADTRRAVIAELVRVSRRYVIASYWDASSFHAWRRRTRGPLRRRGRPETRRAIEWRALREEFETHRAPPIGRAHSLRFVSQQSFLLVQKRTAT